MKVSTVFILLLFLSLFSSAQVNIAVPGKYEISADCRDGNEQFCHILGTNTLVVTYEKNKKQGKMELRFWHRHEGLTQYSVSPTNGAEKWAPYQVDKTPKALHFRIEQVKKKSIALIVLDSKDFIESPLAQLDTVADTLSLGIRLDYTFAGRYLFKVQHNTQYYPNGLKIVDSQTDKEILTAFAPNHSLQLKMIADEAVGPQHFYINFLESNKALLSFNISTQPIAKNPGFFLGFSNDPKKERFFEVSDLVRNMASKYAGKPVAELYGDDPFETYGLTGENVADLKRALEETYHMSFDSPAGKRMDTISATVQFVLMHVK
jgi:hypothetical protein